MKTLGEKNPLQESESKVNSLIMLFQAMFDIKDGPSVENYLQMLAY